LSEKEVFGVREKKVFYLEGEEEMKSDSRSDLK